MEEHAVDGGLTFGLFACFKVQMSNHDKLKDPLHCFWLPLTFNPLALTSQGHLSKTMEEHAVDGGLTFGLFAFFNVQMSNHDKLKVPLH